MVSLLSLSPLSPLSLLLLSFTTTLLSLSSLPSSSARHPPPPLSPLGVWDNRNMDTVQNMFHVSDSEDVRRQSHLEYVATLAHAKAAASAHERHVSRLLETVTDSNCPQKPLELCDFYFDGSKHEIPTVGLDGPSDRAISAPVLGTNVDSPIIVETSGPGDFACVTSEDGEAISRQFYFTGEPSSIHVRAFNEPNKTFFESRCVILKLASIRYNYQNSIVGLTTGDKSTLFPEARRCIVFKTSPSPPSGGSCLSSPSPSPSPSPAPPLSPSPSPSPPLRPPSPPPSPAFHSSPLPLLLSNLSPLPPLLSFRLPLLLSNLSPLPPLLSFRLPLPLLSRSSPSPPSKPLSPPPPPSPPCPTACPVDPLEQCSFYFNGFRTSVPTWNLTGPYPSTWDEGAISTEVKVSVRNLTSADPVVDVTSSRHVAKFLSCPETSDSPGIKFYLYGESARLYTRTLSAKSPPISFYGERCVSLTIVSMIIPLGKGKTLTLTSGDGKTEIPESRRCIVFRTD